MTQATGKPLPISYVEKDSREPRTDYVQQSAKSIFKPDRDYYPTHIVGACTICKTVGTLEFPAGFDFKTGDNVMERRRIKIWCMRCRKETEFVSLQDKEDQEGRKFLKDIEGKMQKTLTGKS